MNLNPLATAALSLGSAMLLLSCMASKFVPENGELLDERNRTFNQVVKLYETPDGFVVVETRHLFDPGNGVCRFSARAKALAYFEYMAQRDRYPPRVPCPKWEWH